MLRGPEQSRVEGRTRRKYKTMRMPAVVLATVLTGSGCTIGGVDNNPIQAKPKSATSVNSHSVVDCYKGNAPVEEVDYCVAFTAIDTARNASGQVEQAFATAATAINDISTPEIKNRATNTLAFARGGRALRMASDDRNYKGAEELADGIALPEVRQSAKNLLDEAEAAIAVDDVNDGILDKNEEKILYEIEDQALLLKVVQYITTVVERNYNFATYYIPEVEKQKTNAAIDEAHQEFKDTARKNLSLWNTLEYTVESGNEGFTLYNEWSRRKLKRVGPDAKPEFPLKEKTELTDDALIVQQFAGFVATMKGVFIDPSDPGGTDDIVFWEALDSLAAKPETLKSHFFVTAQTSRNEKTDILEAWEYTYALNLQPTTEKTRKHPDVQVTIKQTPSGPESINAKAHIDANGHFISGTTKGNPMTEQQAKDALSVIDAPIPNVETLSTNEGEVSIKGGTDYPYAAHLRKVSLGKDGVILISFGKKGPFAKESRVKPLGDGKLITTTDCFDTFTAIEAIEGSEYDSRVTLEIADRLSPGEEEPFHTKAYQAIDTALASTATANLGERTISALEAEQMVAAIHGSKGRAYDALDSAIAGIAMEKLKEHNIEYALHVTELIGDKQLRDEVAKKIREAKNVLINGQPRKVNEAEKQWGESESAYEATADKAQAELAESATQAKEELHELCMQN